MRMIRPASFAALSILMAVSANGQEQPSADDLAGPLDQTVPVADEGAEVADKDIEIADANTPDPLTEQDMLNEFLRFQQLLSDKNFDEADVSAKRIVEMTIKLYGPLSHETAKALNNLAIVQHNNKQFEAATQNFMSSIEIIETLEDRLNSELVNPLKGLGAAQLGNGRPDLATRTFNRATHITHVNEGPHNVEQVEILESLAEANVRLGDVERAREILERIHILNVRHFKDDVLGLLPSLMRRASWQHRAGYFNDERATYRRAIRIIETSAGKEDPRLVDPLLKLGESFYYFAPTYETGSTQTGNSGETYFKRAVRIAENAEDFPWLELATAKLQLADFYTYRESHNRARRVYQEVWDQLSTDEERMELRMELLEQPVPVRAESPPRYAGGSADDSDSSEAFQTGTIRVDYSVSTRGRVRNIRTEAIPAEFTDMQHMVHREIRQRVFRPQLVDGVPVDSGNQIFEHEFQYRQSDLDDLRAAKTEAEQAEQESE